MNVPSGPKMALIEQALGIELPRAVRNKSGRRSTGERECPTCEKVFTGFYGQTYCSPICFYERSPKKTKVCPACDKEFVPDVPGRTYCSLECKHAGLRRPDKPLECAHCHGPMPPGVPFRQKYCSKACSANGVSGRGRWIADGERRIDQQKGYAFIKVDGRWVLEHRVVMEDVLGRKLRPGENVHHKNGKRADNRPDNLELWVRPQPYGGRVDDLIAEALASDLLVDLTPQTKELVRLAFTRVLGVDRTRERPYDPSEEARDVTPSTPDGDARHAPMVQALLDFGPAD